MKLTLTLIITLGLFTACAPRQVPPRIIEKQPQMQAQTEMPQHAVPQSKLPPAPKKKHVPKAVEDANYSDKYMYPEDSKAAKKDPVKKEDTSTSTLQSMTREECISMISQEKFDRYTAMFGSEASSIKRCAMLKAMKK